MATEKDYSISASAVNAVVESAEKIEGAASLLLLLEEKAGDDGTVASPELAAIRSILESCAKGLNSAFQEVRSLSRSVQIKLIGCPYLRTSSSRRRIPPG